MSQKTGVAPQDDGVAVALQHADRTHPRTARRRMTRVQRRGAAVHQRRRAEAAAASDPARPRWPRDADRARVQQAHHGGLASTHPSPRGSVTAGDLPSRARSISRPPASVLHCERHRWRRRPMSQSGTKQQYAAAHRLFSGQVTGGSGRCAGLHREVSAGMPGLEMSAMSGSTVPTVPIPARLLGLFTGRRIDALMECLRESMAHRLLRPGDRAVRGGVRATAASTRDRSTLRTGPIDDALNSRAGR